MVEFGKEGSPIFFPFAGLLLTVGDDAGMTGNGVGEEAGLGA